MDPEFGLVTEFAPFGSLSDVLQWIPSSDSNSRSGHSVYDELDLVRVTPLLQFNHAMSRARWAHSSCTCTLSANRDSLCACCCVHEYCHKAKLCHCTLRCTDVLRMLALQSPSFAKRCLVTPTVAVKMAYQIACGVQYLHSKGITHRYLSCFNCDAG